MASSSFFQSGIAIVHVSAAVILMISVLLQQGKGSGMGAAFGGSSTSVFGARGPAGLIAKVTAAAAVVFMTTSFTLAMAARGGGSASIIPDNIEVPAPVSSDAAATGVSATQTAPPPAGSPDTPVAAPSDTPASVPSDTPASAPSDTPAQPAASVVGGGSDGTAAVPPVGAADETGAQASGDRAQSSAPAPSAAEADEASEESGSAAPAE
ncbi:MAG: preprotein translocase subunit SecG [Deltaproteobacteria bacterium]|jgi:preprotein translocase subunit SecG|nr:preprotein translocase subunit SecG [Deltaproteobacteria bacterium]